MRKILLTLTLAAGLAAPAWAGEEGFTSLFDGKSLDGWKVTTENPGSFLVEDGVLKAIGDRAHLFYAGDVNGGDFKNFELRLKVRTTPGSNSGVYFHTQYQAEGWPNFGYEAQVNSTQTDARKTGSLYAIADWFAPGGEPWGVRYENNNIQVWREAAPSTDGEWFDYTVIHKDGKITIKVDGMTTVEWTKPAHWDAERHAAGHGTFALQAHDPDSEVHYKDIRVKVLD